MALSLIPAPHTPDSCTHRPTCGGRPTTDRTWITDGAPTRSQHSGAILVTASHPSTVIRNARILTMNPAIDDLDHRDRLIETRLITALAPRQEAGHAREIDATGRIALPRASVPAGGCRPDAAG